MSVFILFEWFVWLAWCVVGLRSK